MASLKNMNREELNAEAARLGVADADKLEKNADVIAAIERSDAYKAEQEAEAQAKAEEEAAKLKADQEAARAAQKPADAPKTTYIVNGAEVDPNGNPVT